MPRTSDDSGDDRMRRKNRHRSSSSSDRSRSRDRKKRHQDRNSERKRSVSRERGTDRWPKDGYRDLQRDNFRRDRHRDFQNRNSHLSEEFMAHRRSQREEICERGAPEVNLRYLHESNYELPMYCLVLKNLVK